jgi:DNA primase
VKTIDLADLLCGPGRMRRVGEKWVARCPLPGHEDRSPSFTVYMKTNSWYCFGACSHGGDVVDLAAAAWGYGRTSISMAAAQLLHEFGYEIPTRPAAWFRKQERQRPIRDADEEAWVGYWQRRIYRRYLPAVQSIEDRDERRQAAEHFWDAAREIAILLHAGRMSS